MPEKKYEPSDMAKQIATDLRYLHDSTFSLSSLGTEERDRTCANLMADAIHQGAYSTMYPQHLVEKEEKTNA